MESVTQVSVVNFRWRVDSGFRWHPRNEVNVEQFRKLLGQMFLERGKVAGSFRVTRGICLGMILLVIAG